MDIPGFFRKNFLNKIKYAALPKRLDGGAYVWACRRVPLDMGEINLDPSPCRAHRKA